MKSFFVGYVILIMGCLASIAYGPNYGVWLLVLIASLSVLFAKLIGEVTLVGTTIVLLFFNIIVPIIFLYMIGVNAEVESPVAEIIGQYDWVRAVLPLLSGIAICVLVSEMQKRK